LARSANCNVLTVSAACRAVGATHAIRTVRVLPPVEYAGCAVGGDKTVTETG